MKNYPYVIVTPIEAPLPTEINPEIYGHFYRDSIYRLKIAVWGFEQEEGADKFILLGSYQAEPFYVP